MHLSVLLEKVSIRLGIFFLKNISTSVFQFFDEQVGLPNFADDFEVGKLFQLGVVCLGRVVFIDACISMRHRLDKATFELLQEFESSFCANLSLAFRAIFFQLTQR